MARSPERKEDADTAGELPAELAAELDRRDAAYAVRRAVVLVWLALSWLVVGLAVSCLVQGYPGTAVWLVVAGAGAAAGVALLWSLERLGRRHLLGNRRALVDHFAGRP
ncbi:hypothetical protein ACFCV3_41670 [Kribbella sp. NPDC056345]|uniref:hypothetical protein n=1 Tax=Kribbella sp. NPDC056345 TaxID=3345789 RepID=UPI0035D56444